MKKLFLFAAVATMLAACTTDTTEDVAVNDLPYDVMHVSVGDDDSRIQLDENCRTVWNEGDLVSVFNKTNGNECWQFDGETGDKRGSLSKVSGNAGSKTNKVVALYPYDSNCAVSGNMISTTIPATQTYKADSFGGSESIMVAVSDDNELQFNHIFGWIRLSLTDERQKVKFLTLSGNNNEKLAGGIIIDASTQKVFMGGNNTSTITLNCGEGVQLSKTVPTYFYIAVLPQTFAKGVSINVIMTNGISLEKHYEDPFTVTRNHIQPIKASNFQPMNDIIVYATTDGKPITMEKTEGFGANIISNTYSVGQGIIQFDGDITSIPEKAFSNCKTLTSINIPDSVTSIGDRAFSDCSSLTSVFIPDSVTSIEDHAFYGCRSLTSVTIGDSVTSIGDYAFCGCSSLTSVTIPDSVTVIGGSAFSYCNNLTNISIPDSVTSIGNSAFSDCGSLTSVTIPDSVTVIGGFAFSDCSSLTSITIPDSVTVIRGSAFSDCSSLTSVTIGNGVTSIGGSAFCGCSSLFCFLGKYSSSDSRCLIMDGKLVAFAQFGLTEYAIPNDVTSIGNSAFSDCGSLTSVTIPDSVTSIGDYAFCYCSDLTSITIPDSVTSIGNTAFGGCSSLTSVTIPDSVTVIGGSAFFWCSSLTGVYITDIAKWCEIKFSDNYANPLYYAHNLYLNGELVTDLVIPDSVTSIGVLAFYGCSSLTSVTIGNGVTSIGGSAFCGCSSLTSVTIPDSVTVIGGSAFSDCRDLTNVTIGNGVTSIGGSAFCGCSSLTSVTIPDSVTSIGSHTFDSCSNLINVTIGKCVTSIGDRAFTGCSNLTSITIPDSVTAIGISAFEDCRSLTSIYCKPTTPPTLGSYALYNISSSAKIYVPMTSVNAYKDSWSYYASKIVGYDFNEQSNE